MNYLEKKKIQAMERRRIQAERAVVRNAETVVVTEKRPRDDKSCGPILGRTGSYIESINTSVGIITEGDQAFRQQVPPAWVASCDNAIVVTQSDAAKTYIAGGKRAIIDALMRGDLEPTAQMEVRADKLTAGTTRAHFLNFGMGFDSVQQQGNSRDYSDLSFAQSRVAGVLIHVKATNNDFSKGQLALKVVTNLFSENVQVGSGSATDVKNTFEQALGQTRLVVDLSRADSEGYIFVPLTATYAAGRRIIVPEMRTNEFTNVTGVTVNQDSASVVWGKIYNDANSTQQISAGLGDYVAVEYLADSDDIVVTTALATPELLDILAPMLQEDPYAYASSCSC